MAKEIKYDMKNNTNRALKIKIEMLEKQIKEFINLAVF